MPRTSATSARTVVIIATLTALSGCADSGADPDTDLPNTDPLARGPDETASIDTPATGRAPIAGAGPEEPSVSARERTRSPQGIRDGADGRREAVRGARREGRMPERAITAGVEVRSVDGTNNNIANPLWGATFSRLQRLAAADYSDGIASMVRTDRAGARAISNTIVSQEPGETIPNTLGNSDFSWQWGQFIDHDLDLTDGSADEPQNIAVPTGDPYFDPEGTGTVQIPFNRAVYDPDSGTGPSNVREQENEITSWIDGSMIYGSDAARAAALRVGPDSPYLKTGPGDLLPFNTEDLLNANGPVTDPATLFVAGDVRVNEQVGLSVMHTLFVREHNRLVDVLRARDPGAGAEALFQGARRLLVAELQIITYEEHLPALLGAGAIRPYAGYDDTINPTIYNEFSAAAYRLGHSMVNEQILRIGVDGEAIAAGPIGLFRAFFSAPQLLREAGDIDPILRGLASQRHQKVDIKVSHTLRNLLFGAPGAGGLDLTALNIQRGRDHGLPTYNDARVAMGLPAVDSFAGITDDPELRQSLQDAYGDIANVDLWVGGLAETPLLERGSHLGELFQAIVTRQFTELRDGDRFWYERYLRDEELTLVQDVTLADVIRNNTGVGRELQENVFLVRQ